MLIAFQFRNSISGRSAELFCDKFSLTILRSDLLTSLELFSDKCLCTNISFYLSLFVTLTFDDGQSFPYNCRDRAN